MKYLLTFLAHHFPLPNCSFNDKKLQWKSHNQLTDKHSVWNMNELLLSHSVWPTANHWSMWSLTPPCALVFFSFKTWRVQNNYTAVNNQIKDPVASNEASIQPQHQRSTSFFRDTYHEPCSVLLANSGLFGVNEQKKAVHVCCLLWEMPDLVADTQRWEVTEVIGSRLSIWPHPNTCYRL